MNYVAWNEIHGISNLGPKERKRVVNEILLLKSLSHPNLLKFSGAWFVQEEPVKLVFITELMEAGTLRE